MPKTILIRNVPDALYRELESRANLEGMTLSDYVRALIERMAAQPTLQQIRERLAKHDAGPPA